MTKFKITYSSGLEEIVDQSDVDSVEGLINSKFGISADEVASHGTVIEVLDGSEPVAVVETKEPAAETEEPAAETEEPAV